MSADKMSWFALSARLGLVRGMLDDCMADVSRIAFSLFSPLTRQQEAEVKREIEALGNALASLRRMLQEAKDRATHGSAAIAEIEATIAECEAHKRRLLDRLNGLEA